MLGLTNAQIKIESEEKLPENVILNEATNDTSITIGGVAAEYARSTNIGVNSGAQYGVAVGYRSGALDFGVAVGNNALASFKHSTAIGDGAIAMGNNAIMIGNGKNTEENTFKVAIPKNIPVGGYAENEETGLYTVIDIDGNIPLERLKLVTDQIGDVSSLLDTINGEIV